MHNQCIYIEDVRSIQKIQSEVSDYINRHTAHESLRMDLKIKSVIAFFVTVRINGELGCNGKEVNMDSNA